MANIFISLGAVSGLLAVALGAFGAHALKARLDDYALGVFDTAVQYHFYHTFALLVVATVAASWPSPCERAARHLCPQSSDAECVSLSSRIEAQASPELCTEQIAVLREIDSSSKGDARRYRYLGVIKTLVGEAD